MKSKITRFSTAAAIILAVIISIISIDENTVWAEVIKAFNQADDIYIVKTERSSDSRIIREKRRIGATTFSPEQPEYTRL